MSVRYNVTTKCNTVEKLKCYVFVKNNFAGNSQTKCSPYQVIKSTAQYSGTPDNELPQQRKPLSNGLHVTKRILLISQ